MENIRKITGSKSLKVLLTPHKYHLIVLFHNIISFSPLFLSFLSSLSFLSFCCLFSNEIGIFTPHPLPRLRHRHLLLILIRCSIFRVPFPAFPFGAGLDCFLGAAFAFLGAVITCSRRQARTKTNKMSLFQRFILWYILINYKSCNLNLYWAPNSKFKSLIKTNLFSNSL